MRRALAVAALALTAAAGCGGPAADLFEVTRSGSDRNANVEMVVSDGGTVTCNGKVHDLGAKRLLAARQLVRDLEPQAELSIQLPRGPGTILSYRARMEAGTISFSDTSRGVPAAFERLEAFTADVAENVCGIER
jgi:hypothetical protein